MSPLRQLQRLATLSFVGVSLARSSGADTFQVPADFPTIQSAIDAAVSGDVILVAPGTYSENIDFLGKSITVGSSGGPSVTTIDGGAQGSVATFVSGEGLSSILRGFTLRNGLPDFDSPCFSDGGGVCIEGSSPTIDSNMIIENGACGGGGVAVGFGSPLIRRNLIARNRQEGCSGGVGGGGISVRGASAARIVGNLILDNTTDASGGGISLFASGNPVIDANVIRGNSGDEGGGIWLVNDSAAVITNNLIVENRAREGGGIYWLIPGGPPIVVSNTIAGNVSGRGSGILADGFDEDAQLINNIVVAAPGQTAIVCGDFTDPNPPQFASNNVFSQSGPAYGGICGNPTGTNGNISADPLFMDAVAGDYRLQAGSPSVDTGDNGAIFLPATDIEGKPRVIDGNGDNVDVVDMGAFERALLLCNLDLSLTGRTLRLDFDLASTEPVTWGAWLAVFHVILPLWSVELPAVQPAASFTVPWADFPAVGQIAILTTLSTKEKGLVCLDVDQLDSGGPGASPETLEYLLLQKKSR